MLVSSVKGKKVVRRDQFFAVTCIYFSSVHGPHSHSLGLWQQPVGPSNIMYMCLSFFPNGVALSLFCNPSPILLVVLTRFPLRSTTEKIFLRHAPGHTRILAAGSGS